MRISAPLLAPGMILVGALLGPAQAAADMVSKAEQWFDAITTMQADFIQVASDGTYAEGVLHFRRPHRMKIIYDLDEPLILLTTPVWLHVDTPATKLVTSYPISETPLGLILQENVQLRAPDIETISEIKDGIVSITLNKETGAAAGMLKLEFTEKPFELRRWMIRDATDITTTITLQNTRYGHSYKNSFFSVSDYSRD